MTGAEVLVFDIGETEEFPDKDGWAVQHPYEDGSNMNDGFDSEFDAIKWAKEWMRDHPAPDNTY